MSDPAPYLRIDSHQHFTREYLPSLLYPILKRNRFDGSVVVTPIPSVEETGWLLDLVLRTRFYPSRRRLGGPRRPRVSANILDRYQRYPKFRGLCYSFEGLAADAPLQAWPNSTAGASPSTSPPTSPPPSPRQFPGLRIAIDHVGTGHGKRRLSAAHYPNVFAKISGLITHAPTQWKAAEFQPEVRAALAAFGPERVMYGSDWPSYLPVGTWKEALAAFTQAIGPQSLETREHLLGATARRFYQLEDGA